MKKRKKTCKNLLFVFTFSLVLISYSAFAAEYPITGDELAQKMANAYRGETSRQTGLTRLYFKKNGAWQMRQERETEMYYRKTKKFEEQRIEFLAPADVKGVVFLTKDQDGTDADETFTYLPALKKALQIKVSNQFREFANTDFKNLDLQKFNYQEFTHNIIGHEKSLGHDCYILESTVKEASKNQYDRIKFWVMGQSFVVLRAEFFQAKMDRSGFFKLLKVEKLEKVSGIWTPIKTVMENFVKKTKTEVEATSVEYNIQLDPGLFLKQTFFR